MADSFQGRDRRKHFRHIFSAHDRLDIELGTNEPGQVNLNPDEDIELSPEKRIPVELAAATTQKGNFPGKIYNLGLGGILIRLEDTSIVLAQGEKLVARFSLPNSELPVSFPIEVIHVKSYEDGNYHGCRVLRGEDRATSEAHEKILWRYLMEEQRQKSQLQFETVRIERLQRQRLSLVLRELQKCHRAVARAKTNGLAMLLAILLGLGCGCGLALFFITANVKIWQHVRAEHKMAEDPDFDKLVPLEKVLPDPPDNFSQRRKMAEEKRAENQRKLKEDYANRMKDVFAAYDQKKTSPVMIGVYSGALGLSLLAGVLGFLFWRMPAWIERARQNMEKNLQVIAETYPEEVRAWGGIDKLENPAKIEELLAALEEKP